MTACTAGGWLTFSSADLWTLVCVPDSVLVPATEGALLEARGGPGAARVWVRARLRAEVLDFLQAPGMAAAAQRALDEAIDDEDMACFPTDDDDDVAAFITAAAVNGAVAPRALLARLIGWGMPLSAAAAVRWVWCLDLLQQHTVPEQEHAHWRSTLTAGAPQCRSTRCRSTRCRSRARGA